MAIHPRVRDALEEAVAEADQSKSLTRKLVAWVDELTAGNSRLERKDDVSRHVEACLSAVAIDVDDLGEE